MSSQTFGTRNPRWENQTSLVVDEVNEDPKELSEEGKNILRALMRSSPPLSFPQRTTDRAHAAIEEEEQRRLQRERETAKPTVFWPTSWFN